MYSVKSRETKEIMNRLYSKDNPERYSKGKFYNLNIVLINNLCPIIF